MTIRYYYTDPLACAWMADKFGMGFDSAYDFMVMASANAIARHRGEPFGAYGSDCRFYIHPDSLHLLMTQADDLLDGHHHKIIQRNGTPFMWPEAEE